MLNTMLFRLILARIFHLNLQGHYPSLTQDMKNGRLTEIDYLNGAVSRLGRKHNIATPLY